MKAVVLDSPGNLVVKDISTPYCPVGGVLVRVEIAAICGADIKMVDQGHRALTYPRVLGHEVTGVIEESEVSFYQVGDKVQIAPGIVYGQCEYCLRGATNHCSEIDIIGFTRDGGFAEFLSIPAAGVKAGIINLIPTGVSFKEAVLAEPIACCINGFELVGVNQGDTLLIIGSGPIGCLQAILGRSYGAEQILVADKSAARLKLAKKTGADRLINTEQDDLEEVVFEETGERGVDVIILACGEAAVEYPLLSLLAPRGRVCLFSGLPKERAGLKLDGNLLHYQEMMLVGAYGCTAEQNKKALQMMANGKLEVEGLITEEFALQDIRDAMEKVRTKQGLKSILNLRKVAE
ncbi:alcohol dehydrogenase catalytic domain-containing protein [Fuchsiella alkaliacetigena]|uniref:alcohol dehydrogenase catalytic domain-containing protein n=1 Tax=Fuchsiella alkaliacetigena TaxID=957042 RepID=UPI00200B68EB|nr:alcohol dehydrogenase catalytic domain-containing protein [Fuchsiella alkaliacetigena]MCK8823662.1 alcohol dehydrogenase catalytic domain-containing protein [Fuchsiella alkaliacetigena]